MNNDFELKAENFCYYIDENNKLHLYILNNDRTIARSKKSYNLGIGGHEVQNISAKNFVSHMEDFYRKTYDKIYAGFFETAMTGGLPKYRFYQLQQELNSMVEVEVLREKNRIINELKKVFGVEDLDVVGNSWISKDAKYNLNAFKYCFKNDVCFLIKHKTMERILGCRFSTQNLNTIEDLKTLQNTVQQRYDKYMSQRTSKANITEDDLKEENER